MKRRYLLLILISLAALSGCTNPPRLTNESDQMRDRFKAIIVPEVKFEQADFEDVIEYLQCLSLVGDPEHRGVQIVIGHHFFRRLSDIPKITLHMKNVSILEVLDAVMKQTGLEYVLEPCAVIKKKIVEQSAAPLPPAPRAGPSEGAR